jgi:hypothetical protein
MTQKDILLETLIRKDRTKLLKEIHQTLLEEGFSYKSQNRTMLYVYKKEGRAALRVLDDEPSCPSVFSFPKNFWNQHEGVLRNMLKVIEAKFKIPTDGPRAQGSAGQIEINRDTVEKIKNLIRNDISGEVRIKKDQAVAPLGRADNDLPNQKVDISTQQTKIASSTVEKHLSARTRENHPVFPKSINSFSQLEDFGRVRLSKNFLMREFLHSEISQIENVLNIPDDPELAIMAGRALCENVLEPIQEQLGRISIRSGYRSCKINAIGAANKNQYSCAQNEKNYAAHIWDRRDENGWMGATACIVVCSFIDYYERTADWPALAWWIHDHIPAYARMVFYPKLAAFNISWREDPKFPKSIETFIKNPHTGERKALLKRGETAGNDHAAAYRNFFCTNI